MCWIDEIDTILMTTMMAQMRNRDILLDIKIEFLWNKFEISLTPLTGVDSLNKTSISDIEISHIIW